MTTFVLVHGAFGGSYGFRKVRRLLFAAGHDVLTPSLTGIGERSHLRPPNVDLTIDLALHVRDVVNAMFYDDVTDVVLLGFSYGGMVVTGAMNEIGDRVRELVFLDAFVPGDGQSAVDVLGAAGERMLASATPPPDNAVPPIGRDLGSDEANAWSQARRVTQPAATLVQPVRLDTPLEDQDVGLTYIKATADPAEPDDSPFWAAAHHAEASPHWQRHDIATNHMIPELAPEQLADILLNGLSLS